MIRYLNVVDVLGKALKLSERSTIAARPQHRSALTGTHTPTTHQELIWYDVRSQITIAQTEVQLHYIFCKRCSFSPDGEYFIHHSKDYPKDMVAASPSRQTLKGNSHDKQRQNHLYRHLPKLIAMFGIVAMGVFQWSPSRSLDQRAPQPNHVVHEAPTPKNDEPRTDLQSATMETLRKAPTNPISSNTNGVSTNDIKVSKVIQVSHATAMNRYPDEYAAVQSYLRTQFPAKQLKLMSFGSSYGAEAISLATLYFNETEGFSDVTI